MRLDTVFQPSPLIAMKILLSFCSWLPVVILTKEGGLRSLR